MRIWTTEKLSDSPSDSHQYPLKFSSWSVEDHGNGNIVGIVQTTNPRGLMTGGTLYVERQWDRRTRI